VKSGERREERGERQRLKKEESEGGARARAPSVARPRVSSVGGPRGAAEDGAELLTGPRAFEPPRLSRVLPAPRGTRSAGGGGYGGCGGARRWRRRLRDGRTDGRTDVRKGENENVGHVADTLPAHPPTPRRRVRGKLRRSSELR
jgi:hypothetical protein